MAKTVPTNADVRTARRRAEWRVVVVDNFAEAEAETRAYWQATTPAERLNALESLREPFYGKDRFPSGSMIGTGRVVQGSETPVRGFPNS